MNFESCISFSQKKMHGQWNDIGIDKHSCGHVEFIINTIRYNKYYTTKLSSLNMPIINYIFKYLTKNIDYNIYAN